MNEITLPPAPQWYRQAIFDCASDGTLVYSSGHSLIVVDKGDLEKNENVHMVSISTTGKFAIAVSLNKKWGLPSKHILTQFDHQCKVWSYDSTEKSIECLSKTDYKDTLACSIFAGEDRVVSCTLDGLIIVWNINTDEQKRFNLLSKIRSQVTCLSSCPHASWLIAFGLDDGRVVIADLRQSGRVLHKIRAHNQGVLSFSWCPTPVNIFNIKSNSIKTPEAVKEKKKKENPWVNLVHADDDEQVDDDEEKEAEDQNAESQEEIDDFLKECEMLKKRIVDSKNKQKDGEKEDLSELKPEEGNEVIKRRSPKKAVRRNQQKECDNGRELPKLFDPSSEFLDNFNESMDENKDNDTEKDSEIDKDNDTEKTSDINKEIISKLENTSISEKENVTVATENEENGTKTGEKEDNTKMVEKPEAFSSNTKEIDVSKPEYLLASVARDGFVYIYRAGTDGLMQTSFRISERNKMRNKKSWFAMHWTTPDTILTSTLDGDILSWKLPKPLAKNEQSTKILSDHEGFVFNITSAFKIYKDLNSSDDEPVAIWSFGRDCCLIKTDLKTRTVQLCYTLFNSAVNDIAAAQLDPNQIAMAMKDSVMKILNLGRLKRDSAILRKYTQKITGRLMSVAWHPTKEMVIAFGNDEGLVGYADLIENKTFTFIKCINTHIFKVEWGPIEGGKMGIYAVSNGKVYIYNPDNLRKEATLLQLSEISNSFIYKFSWKPDHSVFLLNLVDGSVVILKGDLTYITTIYFNDKNVASSVWHPSSTTECNNWFASPTAKGFLVYNCDLTKQDAENYKDNIICKLNEQHLRAPTCIAWNPFDSNIILTTSQDGLTHIWNIKEQSVISTYYDPDIGINPAAMWSPLDADLIILTDRYLTIWRISSQSPKLLSNFTASQKKAMEKLRKSETDKSVIAECTKQQQPPKINIIPPIYTSADMNINEQIEKMKLFAFYNDTEIADKIKIDPIQVFGEKQNVVDMMNANSVTLKQNKQFEKYEIASLWQGTNFGEDIKLAIAENRVTLSTIALAPMVSVKLWQEACASYAQKLADNESGANGLNAATYFLACHKIVEAIDILCKNSSFKEALALAKCRLPSDSPIIDDILNKWIGYCMETGNFELATYCYISKKDFEKAAKTISRRNDPQFLRLALELAEKAENAELGEFIKLKLEEVEKEAESDEKDGDFVSRVEAITKELKNCPIAE